MQSPSMYLNLCGHEAVWHKGKNSLKTQKMHFLPVFTLVSDHIGWATLLAFVSINPTNPRTNLWNFGEKILRIGDFEKRRFWKIGHFEKSAILNFFLQTKFFFDSFSWKSVQICMVEWMGWNFDVFTGFHEISCYA